MDKSKVYFTDFRTVLGVSLTAKLQKLIKLAGIGSIDMNGKFVAIKMHFGELGNLAYLRPNYAKAVADVVKELGGLPFLTDCNTLYPGSRKHALEHLDCANINGFNTVTTGCQIIIGDGLRGTDDIAVPVPNGEYCKEAYIGRGVMDADIIISLTHFKGHVVTGFGGVLKNIGMGGGSKRGKMDMHSSGAPVISEEKCIGCGMCAKHCDHEGVSIRNKKAVIDPDNCVGCGHCFSFCPKGAIECSWKGASADVYRKIAEYTQAIIQDKPNFHISFVKDVSPFCDCDCGNDSPVVPDVGVFAGFDPVAVDQACIDAVNEVPIIENSYIGEHAHEKGKHDISKMISPDHGWEEGFQHAERIGLGSRKYNLIKM